MTMRALFFVFYISIGTCLAQDCAHLPSVTTAQLEKRDAPECQLSNAPACQRVRPELTAAIFAGSVVKIVNSDGHIMLDGHCSKTLLQTVTLRVKESFVGGLHGRITVHAGDINGFYFETGKTFLVYAKQVADGGLAVTGCGGTKRIGEAHGDIVYLRAWATLPRSSRVFGEVSEVVTKPGPEPMVLRTKPSIHTNVFISGERKLGLTTDTSGHFEADHLPAGKYLVDISTPLSVWPDKRQKVEVVERGCAAVRFLLRQPLTAKK
jgi:hypothetical protein